MSANASFSIAVTVGIDVGTETTKVNFGSSLSCELVRNDVGGHTTPTAVSFQNKQRHIGETANVKGSNAVVHLNRLLELTKKDEQEKDLLNEFYLFKHTEGETQLQVEVDYNGKQRVFSAAALLAMLLGKIQRSALATIDRIKSRDTKVADIAYLLAVPPQMRDDPHILTQWLDAAYAAGLIGKVHLVGTPTAYAAAYERKFPDAHGDGRIVLIIDMGHAQTTCSVVQFGHSANEGEDAAENKKQFLILASNSHSRLGASSVDIRLFHHFQSTLPALRSVIPKSRAGQRLLQGTHKLKHLLSQLPEGSVTVENVGENDSDIALKATRSILADICEPDAKVLTELIQRTLYQTNTTRLDFVEILGGGCRIPWVKETIQNAIPGPSMVLSRSLDDTSAALGAALVGDQLSYNNLIISHPETSLEVEECRNNLRRQEEAMYSLDNDQAIIADTRNHMEAHILELRSAKESSMYKDLIPDNLSQFFEEVDEWMFSPECDGVTRSEIQAKWQEVQTKTQEMCKEYFNAIAQQQKAQEAEMEIAAKQAQAEKQKGENGEEDDYDNRRLPKKRRMEIIMKNKGEANELFKDGNWRFAAARYTKALSHCTKFIDLSPDDIEEINHIKLTLNLNLALAYMKLAIDTPSPNLDNALRVCNDALLLDGKSAKALYRRASIFYEKKNWDAARQDITKAKEIAGEGDKAIRKLADRVDMQLKKQKQLEKKMASKMFA